MPAGNGAGPRGLGPMSGRGAGYCAGYSVPGYANPARGRGYFGYGNGRGGGRGWRNRYYFTGIPFGETELQDYPSAHRYGYRYPQPEITRETEIKILRNQAEYMQKEMSAINERIKELEDSVSVQKENL